MKEKTKVLSAIAIIWLISITVSLMLWWTSRIAQIENEIEFYEDIKEEVRTNTNLAFIDVWKHENELDKLNDDLDDLRDLIDTTSDNLSEAKKRQENGEKELETIEKLLKDKQNELVELTWTWNIIEQASAEEVFEAISEPIIEQVQPKDILIVCWHWRNQSWTLDDPWAVYWDWKTEREYILEFVPELRWFDTFWCAGYKNTIWEKLQYIEDNKDKYSKVISIQFDSRPVKEWVTIWPKILYAYKWNKNPDKVIWWQVNQDFANELCWKLKSCKTNNTYWIRILNSSVLPIAMIEVADPSQVWLDRWKIQVRNMLNNL